MNQDNTITILSLVQPKHVCFDSNKQELQDHPDDFAYVHRGWPGAGDE